MPSLISKLFVFRKANETVFNAHPSKKNSGPSVKVSGSSLLFCPELAGPAAHTHNSPHPHPPCSRRLATRLPGHDLQLYRTCAREFFDTGRVVSGRGAFGWAGAVALFSWHTNTSRAHLDRVLYLFKNLFLMA